MTTTNTGTEHTPRRDRTRPTNAETGRAALCRAITQALQLNDDNGPLGVVQLIRHLTQAGDELAALRAEHNLMRQAPRSDHATTD